MSLDCCLGDYHHTKDCIANSATEAIKALSKERDALRAENEELKADYKDISWGPEASRMAELQKERTALRAALEMIAQPGLEPFKMPQSMLTYAYILDIARTALRKQR
jgi:hypothetical protein